MEGNTQNPRFDILDQRLRIAKEQAVLAKRKEIVAAAVAQLNDDDIAWADSIHERFGGEAGIARSEYMMSQPRLEFARWLFERGHLDEFNVRPPEDL